MTEPYVLLWSQRQNALHIEPLEFMFTNNRNAYRDNRGGDYRLLLIGTREEVDATCDSMRSTMANREFDMPPKVAA
jgi:hypothetical protein